MAEGEQNPRKNAPLPRAYLILGPIYAGSVSAAGWTVPDQDISE